MKRNFKNINHWLAEVRDIAIKNEVRTPEGKIMTYNEVSWFISKNSIEDYFNDGLTPQEAFEEEMQNWIDNQD